MAEGANLNVSEHWTDAHILRSRQRIAAKRYQEALADLKAAVTIPPNLPVGLGDVVGARGAEVEYWTGAAYEGLGEHEKALEAWNKAAAPQETGGRRRGGPAQAGAQPYYRALALEKLGRNDQAKAAFESLVASGAAALAQAQSRGPVRPTRTIWPAWVTSASTSMRAPKPS